MHACAACVAKAILDRSMCSSKRGKYDENMAKLTPPERGVNGPLVGIQCRTVYVGHIAQYCYMLMSGTWHNTVTCSCRTSRNDASKKRYVECDCLSVGEGVCLVTT